MSIFKSSIFKSCKETSWLCKFNSKNKFSKDQGGLLEAAGVSVPTEVSFNSAYVRVVNIAGTKSKIGCTAVILTKIDGLEISRNDYYFDPDLTGGNFIQQAYNYLKTLPEFAGSTDC